MSPLSHPKDTIEADILWCESKLKQHPNFSMFLGNRVAVYKEKILAVGNDSGGYDFLREASMHEDAPENDAHIVVVYVDDSGNVRTSQR